MTSKRFSLICPVEVNKEGDLCEQEIVVWASPGHPGTRDEPPTGPEITDVSAKLCDHEPQLVDGAYDEDLFRQIEEDYDDR